MAASIDSGVRRPVIIYVIIAIVLFASLLLGVRWAKNRSAFYEQSQVGQSQPTDDTYAQEAQMPGVADEEGVRESTTESSHPRDERSVSDYGTAPQQVPSTGPSQWAVSAISASVLAFTGAGYMRARRRLYAGRRTR